MTKALRHYGRALLLAMWVGAAVFFAAVVAPGAFRVLPSTELAGRVVGHALTWLNITGALLSFALAAYALIGTRERRHSRIEHLALWTMFAALASTEFVINRRIAHLRAEYVIASLAVTDPVRAEFGMLHGASVIVFGIAFLAAVVALFAAIRRAHKSAA